MLVPTKGVRIQARPLHTHYHLLNTLIPREIILSLNPRQLVYFGISMCRTSFELTPRRPTFLGSLK